MFIMVVISEQRSLWVLTLLPWCEKTTYVYWNFVIVWFLLYLCCLLFCLGLIIICISVYTDANSFIDNMANCNYFKLATFYE